MARTSAASGDRQCCTLPPPLKPEHVETATSTTYRNGVSDLQRHRLSARQTATAWSQDLSATVCEVRRQGTRDGAGQLRQTLRPTSLPIPSPRSLVIAPAVLRPIERGRLSL